MPTPLHQRPESEAVTAADEVPSLAYLLATAVSEPAVRAAELDDIRLAILRQHTQLAQVLDELEEHAHAVVAKREDGAATRRLVDVLHTRFVRHLDYEETHLGPWIRAAAGAGSQLLGDHPEQRRMISGLLHDRAVFEDAQTLAREACACVHILRKDMADEEAKLRALR